jgi:hypothetical protein
MRGRQIAGRFISLTTSAFKHATAAQRGDWARLVATMEQTLLLHSHQPGSLVEMAPDLHQRTGGMIGSLDHLIYEAANDAISDGTEKVTRKHLEAVILDAAAQEQYHPVAERRPAAAGRRAAK